MTVRIALTPDSRWPVTTDELVAAAADAGFDALGVHTAMAQDDLAGSFAAHGLACHEVLALSISADADATIARASELAAVAEAMRADWVLTVFADEPRPGVDDLLRRCAAIVGEAGAAMALEPTPLGPVQTLAHGVEVVRAMGSGGVLVDTWHFFNGDHTWDDLAAFPLELLAYVQFDDALPPEDGRSPVAETLHRRAIPGDGTFDLQRFAATLLERGWEGTVSAEVLSAELREQPIAATARRIHDATARYWR